MGAGVSVAGTTSVSAPSDPKEQLAAGIRALNSATFRVAGHQTLRNATTTTESVADPGRRAMRTTQLVGATGVKAGRIEFVALDSDLYVRSDGPTLPGVQPGRWNHIDTRRTGSMKSLGVEAYDDLSGKRAVIDAITSIERTGPRELRGTVDLSKGQGLVSVPETVFGDGFRNAPWQARFDDRGRLAWLSLTVPANGDVPAYTNEFTYSGHGEPVTVERPPARDTVEAPESLYRIFGR